MDKIANVIKQFQALIALFLPLVTKQFDLFPFINPVVVDEMWKLSAIFGALASFGAYNLASVSEKANFWLVIAGIATALLSLVLLLLMTSEVFVVKSALQNVIVRCALVAMFTGFGAVLGCGCSRVLPVVRA